MPDTLAAYLDPAPRPRNPRERVHSVASRIGIAPDLADDYLKVTQVESGHNVNVRDSSKGAKGFGQVMPDRPGLTTRTVAGRRYNLKNPDENIEAGLKLFHAGGSDPVARRLEYFGGAGARRKYERTGRIPNISDGNMSAAQYVAATGGRQQRKPSSDLDSYLDPPSEQTPPPSSQTTPAPSPVTPVTRARPSAPVQLRTRPQFGQPLDPEVVRAGVEAFESKPRPKPATGKTADLFRQLGQQRTVDQSQRQREQQVREEVTAELKSRRGMAGSPTPRGMLHLAADPIGSLASLFKSDERQIAEETQERLRQQQVAESPEVTDIRKEYGRRPAAVRSVAAPVARGGAGLLRVGSGIASAFGIAPNRLSDWATKRAEIVEAGASGAPLREEHGLSSLVTGDAELKEIERGVPEKIVTGIADLGVGLVSIVLLKRATKLPFNQLLALEAAAKSSDKPADQQLARAAEGYALGTALEKLTSRAANAAISGLPAAAQSGEQVAEGRMSPLDAAIQTGIQTASGAILTPRSVKDLTAGSRWRLPDEDGAMTVVGRQRNGLVLENRSGKRIAVSERDLRQLITKGQIERDEKPVETQPDVPAQRAAVERRQPAQVLDIRGEDALDLPDVHRLSKGGLGDWRPTEQPPRFYHRDFGEVVESPNQRRVGKGRVRVTAEDGSEHVIKRSAMSGAGNIRSVPIREPVADKPLDSYLEPSGIRETSASESRLTPDSTTTVKNASMSTDRAARDLPELTAAQPRKAAEVHERAIQANAKDPRGVDRLVEQALATDRNYTDVETAQVRLRAQEIKNRETELLNEINSTDDPQVIQTKRLELDSLTDEFDRLSQATRRAGTEWGRAGVARQQAIDQDFSLVAMQARLKAAKGSALSEQESARVEQQATRIAELEAKLAETSDRLAQKQLQRDVDRIARRERRTATKQSLDEEFAELQTQFAQARAEARNVQASGLAGLDPDGRLTKLIGQMARNRIRAGVTDAAQLVDDIHVAVAKHLPDVDKRQIRDTISGYSIAPKATRSELQKQLDALKSELQSLSKTEDIEAGVRSPYREGPKPSEARRLPMEGPRKSDERSSGIPRQGPRLSDVRKLPAEGPRLSEGEGRKQGPRIGDAPFIGPRQSDARRVAEQGPKMVEHGPPRRLFARDQQRRKQVERQIADLERRMREQDFSEPERKPPAYTRETLALTRQLEQTKADYNRMRYKATRGTGGIISDELAKAANVPKTLKSIGDISAVFRQGGYYALTHPKEGLAKPTHAMLRSVSELGWRNVEAEIKADSDFAKLRDAGVEFTGVDKADPNLTRREEGFLGGDYLDYVPVAKQVKDFSERTFVSFLDAQRLYVGKQILKGLTEAQRSDPKELKAIAGLINAATGRGSLGRRGNQYAPALNIAMFSPRLVASRIQLLNNMVNPVTMARMPPGARKQMIKDNAKFVGATMGILALAKAAGATVSLDPDDAEFLKIRIGNTVYDQLTGLQQPLRTIINLARAATPSALSSRTLQTGNFYAGKSMKEILDPFEEGSFTRSKLNPALSPLINYATGTDFMGRKFSLKREAKDVALPLFAKDIIEGFQAEGALGSLKATPSSVGIGVGSYPPSPEKPHTLAEKLARKLARPPDGEPRTDTEIETGRERARLRARSRAGENVTVDLQRLLKEGKVSTQQAKLVQQAKGRARLSEDIKRLSADEALRVYDAMDASEKRVSAASIRQKLANSQADAAKKRAYRERARQLGLIQ